MSRYSHIVYYWRAFKAFLILRRRWIYFFVLFFWHAKIPSPFITPRCSHYFFFKCFAFFKFLTPSQKSDMNNSIRIIFIKIFIFIRINLIKIYNQNMELISNKRDFTKVFIKKSISSLVNRALWNNAFSCILLVSNQSGMNFNVAR